MTETNIQFKLGQLEARMERVEVDLKHIKKSSKEISDALTKGKGIFIGLIIAASSVGAFVSKIITNFIGGE